LRAAGLLLAALGAVVVVAAGCGSVGRTTEGDATLGKRLFSEQCGSCHTLADAGTQGTIGPNLDNSFATVRNDHGFAESTLRDVVRGQIAYPVEAPPTGEPGMPADLVTGDDADAVAAYVAMVAGTDATVAGPTEAAGGGDGRSIFTSSCSSCHVLAAAGASGTVGPNLDETRPSLELAIDRVTHGQGAMPAFGDSLSEEQIRAVAEFVAENAGGSR
jgi:mono/diheme cytochrome c family protein